MDWAHPDNFFLMHFCQGKELSFDSFLGYKSVIVEGGSGRGSRSLTISWAFSCKQFLDTPVPKPGGNSPTVPAQAASGVQCLVIPSLCHHLIPASCPAAAPRASSLQQHPLSSEAALQAHQATSAFSSWIKSREKQQIQAINDWGKPSNCASGCDSSIYCFAQLFPAAASLPENVSGLLIQKYPCLLSPSLVWMQCLHLWICCTLTCLGAFASSELKE